MNIQDLALAYANRCGCDIKTATSFVKLVFEIVEEYVTRDKLVKIKGLGTFKLVSVSDRESINVNTGERIVIAGHTKLTFTPDASLKDAVNRPFADFETTLINDATSLEDMERIPSLAESEDNYDDVLLTESEENELQSYDNLYNFFNINAFADGCFMIYLNGMLEAKTGSPHMTAEWGSPEWNTKWKSLYGGAYKISRKYIGNYQNTLYLQKWNVDPRCRTEKGGSRNFWGQYMQNIGAAFSESVNIFNALKKQKLLEMPFRFVIPVYENMPELPSPDPADGKCIYYKNGN